MASATPEGNTGVASRPNQLLGCSWLVVTTSIVPGLLAFSTSNAHGDQASPWKYVGLPRSRQRIAVPSTKIRRDPLRTSAIDPPSTATMLATPAPPPVSVSVSFSTVHGRSDETEAGGRSHDRTSMNAGERPRPMPPTPPPQLESVLAQPQRLTFDQGCSRPTNPARSRRSRAAQLWGAGDGRRTPSSSPRFRCPLRFRTGRTSDWGWRNRWDGNSRFDARGCAVGAARRREG